MHFHILGISGTFMGGLAALAKELNFKVTGSDMNIYPPMSTQLETLGVKFRQGFEADQLNPTPDYVVVGNVMRRGIPVVEAVLDQGLPMLSGPEWLARFVLPKRHVLAVSGTHGKTTTSSMLAWILEYAGKNPGFLIGGIPNNFGISARLGDVTAPFVVEADEYDSAFFDKRSKFIHYRPNTLMINNIEFDHADIFPNIEAIQVQFHHLVRTVPGKGLIILPEKDDNVSAVIEKGCWTKCEHFAAGAEPCHRPSFNSPGEWWAEQTTQQGDEFKVYFDKTCFGKVKWTLLGQHNISNALAAIAAAQHVGVDPKIALQALCKFSSVKRRLEVRGERQGIVVYDDFAHHPTAIATTLAGLRAKLGSKTRIVAVVDIRSNTMRAGHHQTTLSSSVKDADLVYFFKSPDVTWSVEKMFADSAKPGAVFQDQSALLMALKSSTTTADHVVFMSNGGFGGIQTEFLGLETQLMV